MLESTPQGLYCPAGDFYIDPSRGVKNAVITHARSDHARRGSERYYCVNRGESLLRERVGKKITVCTHAYGARFQIGPVTLSLHPAGHILGSAQVRLEYRGEVWVASGDYKREADPTCEPFESVPCDVFVTEATFGTPAYVWNKTADVGREIYDWWEHNATQGINSLLFAYSLGKAQRVLGALAPYASRPIWCHPAATALNDCYRAEGVRLAPTRCLSELSPDAKLQGELLLAPHAFLDSPLAQTLGGRVQTAFASGWMATRSQGFARSVDKGFVMSDHADWNDLLRTIQESGAKRVYVQHRNGALVRHLRSLGLEAFPESALTPQSPGQLNLF